VPRGLQGTPSKQRRGGGGSRRHLAVEQAVESRGGALGTFSFGRAAVVALVDLPGNAAAAAPGAASPAGGSVSSLAPTPLLTPGEIDEAIELRPATPHRAIPARC
jgi:hypothetical protein